jgi:hypothetical protein
MSDCVNARPLFLHLGNMVALGLLAAGCREPATTKSAKPGTNPATRLPDISVFLDHPSDRFPVDIDDLCGGHPFMGTDANHPHAGAHAHFDNSGKRWPKGDDEPTNYPAIYAVADGVIVRIDDRFHLGSGNVGPIFKRGPISIVKRWPLPRRGLADAYRHPARRASFLRGVVRRDEMWRDSAAPAVWVARAGVDEGAVEDWATAKSFATGCGAASTG